VPSCIPDSSYQTPAALAPQQAGVQEVIDALSGYTVYGNTTTQIMAQMSRCTAVRSTGTGGTAGNFAASTAYSVSWHSSYNDNGAGLCTVGSTAVSLHINQVFPQWQATSGSSAGLAGLWQTYSSKLHAYEQGHVQLDEAAANTILKDLENLPPTACGSIAQIANTKGMADIANYNAANANYDIANSFGLKQGVTL
jgi:predicted secreted Zn-dependent protease